MGNHGYKDLYFTRELSHDQVQPLMYLIPERTMQAIKNKFKHELITIFFKSGKRHLSLPPMLS